MKKIFSKLFCIMAITALFVSCKKENTEPSGEYYVKAKYDGAEKSFSTTSFAMKTDMGGPYFTLVLSGATNTESSTVSLFSENDDFTSGKVYGIEALGGSTENTYGYTSDITSIDPSTVWISAYIQGSVTEKFECKLTEVTSTYVKGTFSADIYKNESGTPQKIIVTDGEFYVKFL